MVKRHKGEHVIVINTIPYEISKKSGLILSIAKIESIDYSSQTFRVFIFSTKDYKEFNMSDDKILYFDDYESVIRAILKITEIYDKSYIENIKEVYKDDVLTDISFTLDGKDTSFRKMIS